MPQIPPTIRSVILDPPTKYSTSPCCSPNVVHSRDMALADPRSPDEKLSCFHTILNLLQMGKISRNSEEGEFEFFLLARNLILKGKTYTILSNNSVCTNILAGWSPVMYCATPRITSSPSQHLATAATGLPVIMSSGKTIETNCNEIVATLHLTSWVLQTIFPELNILTLQTQ
ncbi:hypothetical protein VP01_1872g3 [Puccinia sorghi]|uniref:Uncharacterized protein n=1 Tax=Puccinia sorghi TaxID=27349 RepID=A0A0L6VF32_9BASI|nr:hypothetical protein VP01_1872g3 [Puccinia sorghi]